MGNSVSLVTEKCRRKTEVRIKKTLTRIRKPANKQPKAPRISRKKDDPAPVAKAKESIEDMFAFITTNFIDKVLKYLSDSHLEEKPL